MLRIEIPAAGLVGWTVVNGEVVVECGVCGLAVVARAYGAVVVGGEDAL